MSNLRVAVVTRRFWPLAGETEYVAANLAGEIHANGMQVEILTGRPLPGWPSSFIYRGCQVHRLPRRFSTLGFRQSFERLVKRYLRSASPKIDSAIFLQDGVPPFDLIEHTLQSGIRVICRMDPTLIDYSGDNLEALAGPGLSECEWIVTTNSMKTHFQKFSAAVSLIPDGIPEVENEWYAPVLDHKTRARQNLNRSHPLLRIRPQDRLAVIAGPVDAKQHIERFVAAWPLVLKSLADAKLWIIGEGSYQQQLWEQITDRNLDDHIVLGGVFDDLTDVFDAADLLLLGDPRRIESPYVLQAQSRGLVVLTSFGLQNQEEPDDLQGVLIADSKNRRELSQVIVDFFRPKTDEESNRESARQKIAKFHKMSDCTQRYLQLLQGNS